MIEWLNQTRFTMISGFQCLQWNLLCEACLQHGFHGLWGLSHTLVVMVTMEFRQFGCHGKQMKFQGRPTYDSITRWQQSARRYIRVVRSQCTIGGIRAWFVRKVAPLLELVPGALWPQFLAFCDVYIGTPFPYTFLAAKYFLYCLTKNTAINFSFSVVATEQVK